MIKALVRPDGVLLPFIKEIYDADPDNLTIVTGETLEEVAAAAEARIYARAADDDGRELLQAELRATAIVETDRGVTRQEAPTVQISPQHVERVKAAVAAGVRPGDVQQFAAGLVDPKLAAKSPAKAKPGAGK